MSRGEWQFNVADPDAWVPSALLAPDGRYSCDHCEGLCERSNLTERPDGFLCPVCVAEEV
jgi:hypothetical protein